MKIINIRLIFRIVFKRGGANTFEYCQDMDRVYTGEITRLAVLISTPGFASRGDIDFFQCGNPQNIRSCASMPAYPAAAIPRVSAYAKTRAFDH